MVVTTNKELNQTVPAKIPRVIAYLQPEVKHQLEHLAAIERRSLSQMTTLLIEQGLKKAKEEGRIPN